MGLAPLLTRPGLFFLISVILYLTCYCQEFFLCPLDKVPLHLDSSWFTFQWISYIWVLAWSFQSTSIVGQKLLQSTTSRSQVRASRKYTLNLLFLVVGTLIWTMTSCVMGGEGCDTSMGVVRAEQLFHDMDPWLSAKQHGMEPRQISESYQTSRSRAVCKRSYIRARNRASLHGHTWYRGKLCTASQLGVQIQDPPCIPKSKNVLPPKQIHRRRLTCFSWNCNGLPPEDWDFLTQWLRNQSVDILLLQETHWRFTRDWPTDHYLAVHSGTTGGKAGLLCLVSKRICNTSNLSWCEHVPGRILQLRLHGAHRSIDILNIYQYTCIPKHMDQRIQIWHQLFSILTILPQRNTLIMAGDFNCSADQRSNAIGYPTFQTPDGRSHGPRHTDAHHWKQLLTQFDIVALNTWNAGDGATYEFGNHLSRIDYICTRRSHADSMAKDVKLLRDFTLVPLTGAFHVPLMTTIRKEWYPD